MLLVDLNCNFEFVELSDNKLSDNNLSDKRSGNNLASELVGNRSFFYTSHN